MKEGCREPVREDAACVRIRGTDGGFVRWRVRRGGGMFSCPPLCDALSLLFVSGSAEVGGSRGGGSLPGVGVRGIDSAFVSDMLLFAAKRTGGI